MTRSRRNGTRRTALGIFGLMIAITMASGFAEAQIPSHVEESRAAGPIRYPVGCSLATLQGTFGSVGQGFVAAGPPPTPLAPFASMSLISMDGAGGLTIKTTRSINGNVSRDTSHGAYTVNEDCTGSMVVNTPGPPFQLTFDLVVGELQGAHATKFYFIATTPGGAVTSTATRFRLARQQLSDLSQKSDATNRRRQMLNTRQLAPPLQRRGFRFIFRHRQKKGTSFVADELLRV